MQDLGDQTLKVVKGKATIELDTPGAKVSIVSGNDRREFPTLPIAVDLDTSKSWALEASKPGFSDYRQSIQLRRRGRREDIQDLARPKDRGRRLRGSRPATCRTGGAAVRRNPPHQARPRDAGPRRSGGR